MKVKEEFKSLFKFLELRASFTVEEIKHLEKSFYNELLLMKKEMEAQKSYQKAQNESRGYSLKYNVSE